MTWQWKSCPVFMSMCVCVGGGGRVVCVPVFEGLHIAQGTNFSNSRIPGANEVRQESAELVNSWRACQMGWQGREDTHKHPHTHTKPHLLITMPGESTQSVENAKLNMETCGYHDFTGLPVGITRQIYAE